MLLGSLNTVVTALLGGSTLPSTAADPAQANAAERAGKAAQDTSSVAATTPGVIFDLSEAALQAVAAAPATSDSQDTTAATAVFQEPPSFLSAGLAIAAELAAANASTTTGATASTAATSTATSGAASAEVQETATAASPAEVEEAADPDEEARARAHAIQAQEREQVLSLVEQLAEARTDALVTLNAPAEDATSEGEASPAAA